MTSQHTEQPSLDDTARIAAMRIHASTGWRAWLNRATEPHVLFPALGVVVLGVIWVAALDLMRVERTSAEAAAAAASLELVGTYEAQVVRALREIDQTLKLVKYAYETRGAGATLPELKARALLPPDLVFAVRVVNSDGVVVASTGRPQSPSAGDQGWLSALRDSDTLWVDLPRKNPASQDWTLQFGRRLNAADGAFAGAVLLAVDASYFVSGYDAAQLGKQGTLGLLGTDGVFRARRTGDTLSAGDAVHYAAVVPGAQQADPTVLLTRSSWDGIRRYTGSQQLFDFPMAVIVGLSEDEQLAAARRNSQVYLWRAATASVLLLSLAALLGRMSWQLARSRARETEANVKNAQRVQYLAYHDALTALPNRSRFNRLLAQAISQAQRHHRPLAVAFIDLDRFKQVNDTLGHEAGDQLLKEVASRLKACLRDGDTVARLGGDEFVVLLTELSEEKYAATVARKILASIANPFVLLGNEIRVTASIGISTYPNDGPDEQTLTKNADIAMYQAKTDGKNNFHFYSKELNANSLERLALETNLRHAIGRHEFRLEYQPKREIEHGRITGMEALLRWHHPDLGVVAPMQFIPLAEETGLIVPIGKWVLQTACLQNVAWQQQGLPRLIMAVNLSAPQFGDEHLLQDVAAILDSTGMEPCLLELEVHESVLIQNIERTLRILTHLKSMGIRIAIDDFGTGYSSLATLHPYPLDTIKIDREFVQDVAAHDEPSPLTEAIIAVGKSLSLTVVAQGVETKQQAEYLRAHACDEFQGFYFDKPMSAYQFTALLHAENPDATLCDARAALTTQQR